MGATKEAVVALNVKKNLILTLNRLNLIGKGQLSPYW